MIHQKGLKQHNNQATRQENNLDLFLTNTPRKVKKVYTETSISDHESALMINMETSAQVEKPATKTAKIWNKANWDIFREKAKQAGDEIIQINGSVSEMWEQLSNKLKEIINELIPTKNIKPHKGVPWINSEIKREMRKRDKIRKKYQRLK